ncbi:leucine-rich repeat-containing protein 47-like [Hyalella azteca]|uniref:Leucine-rich repeat-containing protein 47-like n=1 Tax=Hyalella azteca TaxID=294128 RepID=A0A8B7N3Q3_HYAAZ|nr:leucine-rich repeat-containing protein 47-like [Hyalella azteca]
MWDIFEQIKCKGRRELSLSNVEIQNRENEIADESSGLFSLTQLNLLRINKSQLTKFPAALGQLKNLTSLVCSSNKLESLPKEIGCLTKLMLLDASNNKLSQLPEEVGTLEHLTTLNVNCNELTSLPDLSGCKALALMNASQNHLKEFFIIKEGSLELLAEVDLSNNKIESVPLNIGSLPLIKILNLENNEIKELHGNVLNCPKLKILKLSGNELRDRRFRKLVDAPRTSPEQVLKFVRQHFPLVEVKQNKSTVKNGNDEEDLSKGDGSSDDEGIVFSQPSLTIEYPSDDLLVCVTTEVLALRPHLVCCVVRNISLLDDKFKKFIVLQNKLHEGVCKRRLYSTIATHDLSKIQTSIPASPGSKARTGLSYTAQAKDLLKFVPLNRRSKPVTAAKFLTLVQDEADKQRKMQKSNNISGLYKYLQLVEGWTSFPCLLDAAGTVLSVPPLTNGDATKISTATTDMLLEVTSDKGLHACKQTMTELLQAVIDVNPDTDIIVQQVRVLGADGGLRCVFPASDDLTDMPSVRIIRPKKS